ncbi:Hypothetical predicted protein [Olea europaea subsp. europaea]|uniref:Uncharacterized protein n=1 Tax=Olea europaea subsp. europaea TaxID=158383 RepID=A0A8S0PFJ1_OLEEU|nr:Hypothetical predicted protein [Olea europaea subsp. europaea]
MKNVYQKAERDETIQGEIGLEVTADKKVHSLVLDGHCQTSNNPELQTMYLPGRGILFTFICNWPHRYFLFAMSLSLSFQSACVGNWYHAGGAKPT